MSNAQPLILLPRDEYENRRIKRLRDLMTEAGLEAMLITDNANTFYITGRVFMGWIYLPLKGEPIYFVRRPMGLEGDGVIYIRKPELIAESIGQLNMPARLGMELDVTPWSTVSRLAAIFDGAEIINCSTLLRQARAVKTDYELELLRASGDKQSRIYRHIAGLYKSGMTDLELQIEIEHKLRLEGCLGQFRISGDSMELFMGSVLVGDNADNPTPYDFAMGGEGINPSIPAGANGTVIQRGDTVMVDMNGNFTGYMTDMTRTYSLGTPADKALRAHQCSTDICHTLEKIAVPGTPAKALYQEAERMATESGFHEYFMGHRQKAGFIGHGVGIEINELPVISPHSRDILAEGNVIALEPKFVIPGTGAVGIENTYLVSADGLKPLVDCSEWIQHFSD